MISDNTCLSILISTLNEGIYNLEQTVALKRPEIRYLIIHQTKKKFQTPDFLNREDITIIKSSSTGLSKSRNIAIKNCVTEYGLIADDDVEYISEGIDEVIKIIKSKKPDFATFKIKTPEFEQEYKNYAQESFEISLKSHHFFSSVEILLNVNLLKNKNIYFDERFGLGTPLKASEEEILIYDLITNNNMGCYYPIYIVEHPYESSGKQNKSYNFKIFKKGALDARLKRIGYSSSSKSLKRKLLKYAIYYYGVAYVRMKLPNFLVFIK
ncbi:MAG: glycosyltransferase [Psychroflexus halocasei]